MRARERGAAALLLVSACLVAPLAQASPAFELVGSAFGDGGLNARATGSNAASAYFNPALLAGARQSLALGWVILRDDIDITLYARQPSADVPVLALNTFQGQLPSLPTAWLEAGCDPVRGGRCASALTPRPRQGAGTSGETHAYQALGLVSHAIERYLTVGLYALVPFDALVTGQTFFADEREQYFSNSLHPELYSDRLSALSFALSAGSQVFDWLALGIGAALSLKTVADAGTYVGNSARISETLQLSTKLSVPLGVSPFFGAVLTPLAGLDVSLTVHTPQEMELDMAVSTFLPNGDLQRARRRQTFDWLPWTLGTGVQYDFVRSPAHVLGAVATIMYRFWSDYVDRQGERPRQGYEWSNTFQFGLGLRHRFEQRLASYADFAYEPTPVPAQTGRSNYVDNDKLTFAAGLNYEIPRAISSASLRLGVQAQLQLLLERAHTKLDPKSPAFAGRQFSQLVIDEWADDAKDNRGATIPEAAGLQTNNPGWPGFSSKGTIFSAGASAALLY